MKKLIRHILIFFLIFLVSRPLLSQEISKAFYVTAKEYLKSDSLNLALIELDSAIKISPNFADAYVLKGKIFEQKKEYRRAVGQYSLALLHNPNLVSVYLDRGALYFKLKDHRNYVLNDVNKAISLSPQNAELYRIKAYYYANTFSPETLKLDFGNAILAINSAVMLDSKQANYLKLRSEYKLNSEQKLSALIDINKAIEIDNLNDTYYHFRGVIKFVMGDFRASLNDINRAIELDSSLVDYHQLRGNVHYNLEKYEEAYADYSLAINLTFFEISQTESRLNASNPLNHQLRQTLMLRGMSLVHGNKPYDGCDDFKRAMQMGESKASNYIRKYCQ